MAERGDRPLETVLELDLGLPAENLLRARDVGLTHLRIVDGKRLEHDLARRSGQPDDGFGELEQRLLVRVAEIYREVLVRLDEQDDPADQVIDVAEAPRLRAVAEDGDRLPSIAWRRNVGMARPSLALIRGP